MIRLIHVLACPRVFGRLEEVLVMGLRMTDGIDHEVNPSH